MLAEGRISVEANTNNHLLQAVKIVQWQRKDKRQDVIEN